MPQCPIAGDANVIKIDYGRSCILVPTILNGKLWKQEQVYPISKRPLKEHNNIFSRKILIIHCPQKFRRKFLATSFGIWESTQVKFITRSSATAEKQRVSCPHRFQDIG